MANSTTSSNPFFEAWLSGSEQLMRTQSNWFTNFADVTHSADATEVVEHAKKNWDQCESQFNSWLAAVEQWSPNGMGTMTGVADSEHLNSNDAFEKLKIMLNPETFLSSGVDELNQVFQRLAEGPDFADIGVLEKKFMRTGQDWANLRNANAEYQMVIAKAWANAFDCYVKELSSQAKGEQLSFHEMMQRWLKVANASLIQVQRSEEFLVAQRKLFKTNTQYKLKQREVVEAWCESYTMPTRSEVDDLHQMVYELRREVRQLKTQLQGVEKKAKQEPEPLIQNKTVSKISSKEKQVTESTKNKSGNKKNRKTA